MVDEAQDLDRAQLELAVLLAGGSRDIFLVGDDDQTIYGYNGADPAWLIDFAELFPGAGDHPLPLQFPHVAQVDEHLLAGGAHDDLLGLGQHLDVRRLGVDHHVVAAGGDLDVGVGGLASATLGSVLFALTCGFVALLAGAAAVQVCSALYRQGKIEYLGRIEDFLGEEEMRTDIVVSNLPADAATRLEDDFDEMLAAAATEPRSAPTLADDPGLADTGIPGLDQLAEPWFGDLTGMVENRIIRAGVVPSRTLFFLDGARARGLTFDALNRFEEVLNEELETGHLKVHVVLIPLPREDLLPALADGRVDMAAANLTITEERTASVDFSEPLLRNAGS